MKKLIPAILLLLTASLSAQIATEGAVTVDQSVFRIESIGILNTDKASNERLWNFNNLFRIGVFNRLEFRVGHDYFANQNFVSENAEKQSGFGDMNAGLKVQLFRSKKPGKFDLAFMGTYSFPTGIKAFTNDRFFTNHLILGANAINDNMGFEYNFGYQDGEEKGDLIYTISYSSTIVGDITAFIEYYGAMINLEEGEHNIDFGFNYSIKDNWQVDATFGLPLMKKPNTNFFSVGVYYEFDTP